jgi:hypothetical protein
MARRITDPEGATWEVTYSGHRTQYNTDELTLEFVRTDGGTRERRFARFSPRGAKSVDSALDEMTDHGLANLLKAAQPAWTSPDGEYSRSG